MNTCRSRSPPASLRAILDPLECLLGRGDVVEDLQDRRRELPSLLKVGFEHGCERGEGALQRACALSLATDRGSVQEIGRRDLARRLIEAGKRGFGASDDRPSAR
jgi:hypothetical protein